MVSDRRPHRRGHDEVGSWIRDSGSDRRRRRCRWSGCCGGQRVLRDGHRDALRRRGGGRVGRSCRRSRLHWSGRGRRIRDRGWGRRRSGGRGRVGRGSSRACRRSGRGGVGCGRRGRVRRGGSGGPLQSDPELRLPTDQPRLSRLLRLGRSRSSSRPDRSLSQWLHSTRSTNSRSTSPNRRLRRQAPQERSPRRTSTRRARRGELPSLAANARTRRPSQPPAPPPCSSDSYATTRAGAPTRPRGRPRTKVRRRLASSLDEKGAQLRVLGKRALWDRRRPGAAARG